MERRNFIRGISVSSSLVLSNFLLGSCKHSAKEEDTSESSNEGREAMSSTEKLEKLTFQNTFVRQPIHTLGKSSDIIIAYKDAVKKMRELPANNPLSWNRLASIHSARCQHRNWFFLPWHRAYLYFFERICRKLSGYENFALPYWDWTEYPKIPEHFWGDSNNSLVDTTRRANSTISANSEFVGIGSINSILAIPDFFTFGSSERGTGELEGTPHNYIHRFVSGNMVTGFSPLDPIFWCHHSNVDRIWLKWYDRGNAYPLEQEWLGHKFENHFFDENGDSASINVGELISTRNLGYTYESNREIMQAAVAGVGVSMPKFTNLIAEGNEFSSSQDWIESQLEINSDMQVALSEIVNNPQLNQQRIILKISGLTPPSNEDFFVRIFVNCPYLSKDVPINDPQYIGSFTFFGTNHEEHDSQDKKMKSVDEVQEQHNRLDFVFDVTEKYDNVVAGLTNETGILAVQLLAIPFDKKLKNLELKPKRVELLITS